MRRDKEPCDLCPNEGVRASECLRYFVCNKCYKHLKKEDRRGKKTVHTR